MIVLTLLCALQGIVFIGGHMVKSDVQHGIHQHHGGQVYVENFPVATESEETTAAAGTELHKSLTFFPSTIDFGAWSIGTARSHLVTLVNKNTNRSVYLSSISGNTPAFYSSFFEDKVVPPQGNTTFNVVFLPRTYGDIEANLLIHTSFGQAKLPVKGKGKECPYRLKPLVGIKAPMNSTLRPEIYMYNPHSRPIQILEVYSSGGQFQLELPSGGQEGPQALWEIPPLTSKPVIRIRFHGSAPGNHTAYIRIKLSGIDEDPSVESILVIPAEFEILEHFGLYSPNPILEFGYLTSNDDITTVKISLTNSGKEKIQIVEMFLRNVEQTEVVKIDPSDQILTVNPRIVTDNVIITGELIVRSHVAQSPKQIMELSIAINAQILKGALEFDRNTTVFVTKSKNYTRGYRTFFMKNTFKVPIAVTNLTLDINDTSVFDIRNFSSTILQPDQKVALFKIAALNETTNFLSTLRLHTNLTIFKLDVIVCTGMLNRYTSMDRNSFTAMSDPNILEYGSVPYGDFSHFGLIIVHNPNPVRIQFMEWDFITPKSVYFNSMFLGCLKENLSEETATDTSSDPEKTVEANFDLCRFLNSSGIAVFQLALQSFNLKYVTGTFKIRTEYEEIVTQVKFVTVMGRLEIDQSKLHFANCFPGKRCSAEISIHSTFLKTIRVNAITVSVPGLIFEYNRVLDGLPTIAANTITDVGRIYFDPISVCRTQCYLTELPDKRKNQKGLYFDENELRYRTELFRKFKWSLQTITFTLNTTDVRLFEFSSTVDMVWPKFVQGIQTLNALEVGQLHEEKIIVSNPSDRPLMLELSLADPKKAKSTSLSLPLEVIELCVHCYLTDENVFELKEAHKVQVIKPMSQIAVTVRFSSKRDGVFSTLMHIKNNLTMYEAVWITAKAVQPQFRFGNRKPGSNTPLLFEVTEKHLAGCAPSSAPVPSNEPVLVHIKRTFTARNTGEVPILVKTFQIGNAECIGYGFKILDCKSFELKANSSKKIEIAFSPDFTATRITRPLILVTNLSYSVNYTLLATLPADSLQQCSMMIPRPFWEMHMKKIGVGVLAVAFMLVLIVAFIDSDKILREHVQNMSKEKGPVQPTLDLRTFGSAIDKSVCVNSNDSQEKKGFSIMNLKKRPVKRSPNNNYTANAHVEVVSGRDKSWMSELATKIGKRTNENNVTSSSNASAKRESQESITPLVAAGKVQPSTNRGVKAKEEKQTTPPKPKSNTKESEKSVNTSNNSDRGPREIERKMDMKFIPEVVKTPPPSIQPQAQSIPVETKRQKANVKKTKSNNSPSTVRTNGILTTEPSTVQKVEEKPQKQPPKQPPQPRQEHATKRVHQEPSVETGPAQTPPQEGRSSSKKYGKTPGRERKKEHAGPNQFRKSDRKSSKLKTNAFQFSSPLPASSSVNPLSNNAWNPNQASFSHVVAQKSPVPMENTMVEKQHFHELNNHGAGLEMASSTSDFNEADLKNHETFGCDAVPIGGGDNRPAALDLGPIGTRKSPSSTPVWEPFQHLERPVPSVSSNTSFFSNSFLLGNSFEYGNHYLGNGASELLDQLLSQSQKHRNDFFGTLTNMDQQQQHQHQRQTHFKSDNPFQQQQPQNFTNNKSNWQSNSLPWHPMGYDQAPASNNPNPWQTANTSSATSAAVVRPPPGIDYAPRVEPSLPMSPTQVVNSNNVVNHQNPNHMEPNSSPMQEFDPFSSLSSIWSDNWNRQHNNNNNHSNK